MSVGEIGRIVRAAMGFGLRQVRLTGGEPLVREDIIDIVRSIAESGVQDLSLTTNGIKLTEMAGELKEAGLKRLNISLDSLRPDRYRDITRGGDLNKALAGIKAAEEAGLDPVKINMVPMRGVNDDEIPEFARMTLERPVHIRFIEYMPAGGRRGKWDKSKFVSSDEALKMAETAGPLIKRKFKGKGPSRNYYYEGAPGIVGFISALSHSFCYCCNRIRVTSHGRLRSCLFSSSEIDVLGPMRGGASDAELERLFGLAIETKPEGNYLKEPEKATKVPMSSIGG